MYSIKLMHGHALSFDDGTITRYDTAYCELQWQGDGDEKPSRVAETRSIIWTPKTAKRADAWARERGLDLKAEYGAYLRKHGERKEVVEDRKRKAEEAERKRIRAIKERCMAKWEAIIKALASHDDTEALARELEHG